MNTCGGAIFKRICLKQYKSVLKCLMIVIILFVPEYGAQKAYAVTGFLGPGMTGIAGSVGFYQTGNRSVNGYYVSFDAVGLVLFNLGLGFSSYNGKDDIERDDIEYICGGLGLFSLLMIQGGNSDLGPVIRIQSHIDLLDILAGRFDGPFSGKGYASKIGISIGGMFFVNNSEMNQVTIGLSIFIF